MTTTEIQDGGIRKTAYVHGYVRAYVAFSGEITFPLQHCPDGNFMALSLASQPNSIVIVSK